jgi:hypothetical protein
MGQTFTYQARSWRREGNRERKAYDLCKEAWTGRCSGGESCDSPGCREFRDDLVYARKHENGLNG